MGNNDFSMWVNDRLILFDQEEDSKLAFFAGRLHAKIVVHNSGYDPSQLSLMVGGEGSFPGFMLHFYRADNGELYLEESDQSQLAGHKFFGLTSLQVLYRNHPLMGYRTQVRFELSPQVQDQVEFMRQALQNANAAVFDFFGLSKQEFILSQDRQRSEYEIELEGFLLLNQFFQEALAYFRSGVETFDCELTSTNERMSVPINQVRPITADVLFGAYRQKEKFISYSQGHSHYPSVIMPLRAPLQRRTYSYNTPANQQALYILSQMKQECIIIISLIEKETSQYGNLRARLGGGYASHIDYKLHRLRTAGRLSRTILRNINGHIQLLNHLGVENSNSRPLKGSIKPIYASLFRAFNHYRLRTVLAPMIINVDERHFPLQTHSINHLYEIWVVHTISKAMVERLGFKLGNEKDTLGASESRPLGILKSGQILTMVSPLGDRVLFHYDKKYPLLSDPFCQELLGFMPISLGGRGPISKNNPDISIEFYEGYDTPPKIIVLDSTYSDNPVIHEQKTTYEDTIRYRSNTDETKEEWEQPVRVALAVHPFPKEDGLSRRREIVLVPGMEADNQAEVGLRALFKRERLL